MKINEEFERLLQIGQQSGQTATVGKSGGDEFESLLAKQLGQQETAASDPDQMRALADPMRLANITVTTLAGMEQANEDDDALIEQLTLGLASALDNMDKLAVALQNGTSTMLRDAWSSLENVNTGIAQLRQEMGKLSTAAPELEGMLNELEVLATTETFKFNRGDYFL